MEQPPTPSNPDSPATGPATRPTTGRAATPGNYEPDLPKPPIWERTASATPASATPPINIPRANDPAARQLPRTTPPIVPDISAPTPLAQPAITQPVHNPGPTFAQPPSTVTPASGAGVTDRPLWPAAPPVAGAPINPIVAPKPKRKRRTALMALAVLLAAAVALGGFFFGRSVASSESTSTAVSAPATSVPTPAPTSPPATDVPVPTPAPAVTPPVNDAPSPVLPGEGADEPVAAVAQAVGPAVVLIQNDLGQGSGIIYDESGLILTNAHVVGQFTEVLVTLASGVAVEGRVLGADPLTDVAVVDIDTDSEFAVAVLAPESSVQVGQLAVAIGSPFGLEQTVTSGIVSAVGRVLQNPIDDGTGRLSVVSMIQTDAPINPGNSGGALVDRQGRVIGMNTSIRTDGSGGNIGVGFAIPSDTARLIADRIVAGEPLEQGFLGINGSEPLIGDPGVVIGDVFAGGGAEAAGLQTGDRITRFNGIEIKSMSDLAAAVRLQPPDVTVAVEFVRGEEPLLVDVTLGVLTEQ